LPPHSAAGWKQGEAQRVRAKPGAGGAVEPPSRGALGVIRGVLRGTQERRWKIWGRSNGGGRTGNMGAALPEGGGPRSEGLQALREKKKR